MPIDIALVLSPKDASDKQLYLNTLARKLSVKPEEIKAVKTLKRSIDARNKDVKINLYLQVFVNEEPPKAESAKFTYSDVSKKSPVIVVGAGPAGLFAALRLIELGLKPIVLERGKDVSQRKRDVAQIYRNHEILPDSNYCFGEGGAGAFSDGKLYTRSQKRGDPKRILNILHFHGASEEILVDAHPHIGTDKLPKVIQNIRETIINAGGEVHFDTRVVKFIVENDELKGVETANSETFFANSLILATGHSARDIYETFHQSDFALEAKPFAMGVRVEHPQELIDNIQYHKSRYIDYLPAASYNLVSQIDGRGVYSFCMCPGGFIVPSSTSPDEMVVNGMSPSSRNSPYANSGIVVEIKNEDFEEFKDAGVLAGLKYQQKLEQLSFNNGGHKQTAPAQRLLDFVQGKISPEIPENSYIPGTLSSPMHFWLPTSIGKRLQQGFVQFDKMMRGYLTNDAVILGVESRTSSPIRIPRNDVTMEHIQIKGLFPCGEGAGYAGGIVSSAMDGEKSAEGAAKRMIN